MGPFLYLTAPAILNILDLLFCLSGCLMFKWGCPQKETEQ